MKLTLYRGGQMINRMKKYKYMVCEIMISALVRGRGMKLKMSFVLFFKE